MITIRSTAEATAPPNSGSDEVDEEDCPCDDLSTLDWLLDVEVGVDVGWGCSVGGGVGVDVGSGGVVGIA